MNISPFLFSPFAFGMLNRLKLEADFNLLYSSAISLIAENKPHFKHQYYAIVSLPK